MMKKLVFFILLVIMLVIVTGCTPGSVIKITTPEPNSIAGSPTPSGQINVPGFKIQITLPGPNPQINVADADNRIAGILLGIWHGIISPVTMVLSFINPNIQIYEVHNNGAQYNLGFLIGVAIVFLFLGVTAGRRR
ncbi:MAG TPA: hypothetical protein VFC41_06615 [Anaerovoracaceae bacterium]|nr:hypothetical protein [Anaerovoracaceae bacterium]